MYNQQQGFQNSLQNNFSPVTSQYRGLETRYQPIGNVQSQYNASQSLGQQNQFGLSPQNFASSQQYSSQAASPQSYHTANYRGNQPGHDAYLRSDSSQPAQSQFGMSFSSPQLQNQLGASSYASSSSYGQQYSQQQYASPQSYHTANYRGDQPGHDSYLREDSNQPAQSQFGSSSFSSPQNFSSFGMGLSQLSQPQQSYGQQQYASPQSYHTANYRGNQPGHDAYLRSDSSQPAQSQFGLGASQQSFNRYQF